MLGQEVADGGEFGVVRFRAGQFFDDGAGMGGFGGGEGTELFEQEGSLLFTFKQFAPQHFRRGAATGSEAGADALEQERLHEAGGLDRKSTRLNSSHLG